MVLELCRVAYLGCSRLRYSYRGPSERGWGLRRVPYWLPGGLRDACVRGRDHWLIVLNWSRADRHLIDPSLRCVGDIGIVNITGIQNKY